MASKIYWTAIVLIVATVLTTGFIDLGLWLTEQPTITSYLRKFPRYFFWPALVLVEVVLLLIAHLYGQD